MAVGEGLNTDNQGNDASKWDMLTQEAADTTSEKVDENIELSESEKGAVESFQKWNEEQKQKLHDAIVSGLGYQLDIPGYGLNDVDNPDAKPSAEDAARLEHLYDLVVNDNPDAQKNEQLSEAEAQEVEAFKVLNKEQEQKAHDTIISGIGYHLDIPGYRFEDADNPDIKPSLEQQKRLEQLYKKVVG